MYHVRNPLASHSPMLAYDQPAYMLRNPTRELIRIVKRKFSSLKFSGAVLLKYPARLVIRAMTMATGAALAAAQIPCARARLCDMKVRHTVQCFPLVGLKTR